MKKTCCRALCKKASTCVVSSDSCCKGASEPVVFGHRPKSFKCLPWKSSLVISSFEQCHRINSIKGWTVARTMSFLRRKGVKFPTMARLHLPSDHQPSLDAQMSLSVFNISSPQTSQLKFWWFGDPTWHTVQAHFQPDKQFSSNTTVVSSARSQAEKRRKVISRRSALMPVIAAYLAETGAESTMSMSTFR